MRSLEWYLLDPIRRRDLLVEHGRMGRGYPDVRANTVSAFGLGDYEWLLAFEADDLGRIVDLIRHLRGAEARLYTKEELPFITGRRRPLAGDHRGPPLGRGPHAWAAGALPGAEAREGPPIVRSSATSSAIAAHVSDPIDEWITSNAVSSPTATTTIPMAAWSR